MDNFSKFVSIDNLLSTKTAEAELLLAEISISNDGSVVKPVKCPAVGRKEDYLKDNEGNPACYFGSKKCKYFIMANFRLDEYEKKIMCSVI